MVVIVLHLNGVIFLWVLHESKNIWHPRGRTKTIKMRIYPYFSICDTVVTINKYIMILGGYGT